ncbi:MAG: patatin-like phospholipase family protein [Candidatus Aphodosoma sp.]
MKRISLLILAAILAGAASAQRKNVGIVLSGGGALGFAHIGVLQALEDNGIKPQVISGTSMGALIGAMYANGMSPQDIFEMVKAEQLNKLGSFLDISVRNTRKILGASSQDKLHDILLRYLPHDSFDSLQMPFYLCVTNLSDAQMVIMHRGNRLVEYLQGSSCIPGCFAPTVIDGKYYVDGGIYNNLPAQPIRKLCKILIASDVNAAENRKEITSMGDVMSRSLSLLIYENTKEGRNMCDYLINVPVNHSYKTTDYNKFYEIYQIGYSSGMEFIKSNPDIFTKAKNVKTKK